MTDIKPLGDSISVSPQITVDDIKSLAAKGIKTIICNRPDGEDPGQPEHQQLQQAAEALGLDFYFMPVVSGAITAEDGQQFSALLKSAQHPVHAYCRSGTRCTILWALSEINAGTEPQTIINRAASAGYNISNLFS